MIQNEDITATRVETEPTAQEDWDESAQNPAVGSPFPGLHKGRASHRSKSSATDDVVSPLLSVEEVALLLNVPRKWVYRRIGLKPPNGIPHLKVGKYVRFKESDIRDYLERLRRNR